MSSNDWPSHQEQLRREQEARETVNQALLLIGEKHGVDRPAAIKLLVDVAQAQHRIVSALAADVVRTGALPGGPESRPDSVLLTVRPAIQARVSDEPMPRELDAG